MASPARILIIEDEEDIAELIRLHLTDAGFVAAIASDGTSGFSQASTGNWDLIVLDLRLPGVDGMEICRRLRQASNSIPVLMLTSKSSELDRVVGLEIGADDYVTKPFSIPELLARIKAILRRAEVARFPGPPTQEPIRVSGVEVDPVRRSVNVRGASVELTAREFDLLLHFASHPERVFRRTELLDSVWGYGHDGYEHTVNSHINRLRAKIETDPAHPSLIVTVWGVGYKLAAGTAARQTA